MPAFRYPSHPSGSPGIPEAGQQSRGGNGCAEEEKEKNKKKNKKKNNKKMLMMDEDDDDDEEEGKEEEEARNEIPKGSVSSCRIGSTPPWTTRSLPLTPCPGLAPPPPCR